MMTAHYRDQEKKALKRAYGQLYAGVLGVLTRHDPIGIAQDNPYKDEEYAPEAGSILPRLKEAQSPSDVQRIVHEEFVWWFGSETGGPAEAYGLIALEIWDAWNKAGLADKV